VPPDSTVSEPRLLTVVWVAEPPDSTICEPKALTVTPLALPQSSCWPPSLMIALISVPPAETASVPQTFVRVTEPPFSTTCTAPGM
jgi:hypothetical protein